MANNSSLGKGTILRKLGQVNIPRHIAIIMDGNGRWALSNNLPRLKGHQAGVKSVDEITESCAKIGVKRLTLYAFSSENWRRPRDEVEGLMRMLHMYLIVKRGKIMQNRIRLTTIGDVTQLPSSVKKELDRTVRISRNNSRMTLCLALNYGGQQEIIDAVRTAFKNNASKTCDINQLNFRKYMYDPEMAEPDLLIRTGGEIRISNFLLWHISYTELYFTKVLWPDFRTPDLIRAVKEFSRRSRRYGGIDDYQG